MTCLMFDERSAALLFHFGRVLRKRNRGRIMIGRFRNSCGLLPPVLITRYFGRKPCISQSLCSCCDGHDPKTRALGMAYVHEGLFV